MKRLRVLALLAAGAFASPANASDTVVSYDASSLPSGWAATNLTVTGTTLSLSLDGTGAFLSEGYLDIPFSPSYGGQLLQIDAERVNLFVNGDFESDQTVRTYLATSACGSCTRVGKGTGNWLTDALWGSSLPSIESDGSGGYAGKLRRGRKLLQIVPVVPDEEYTFRADVDASRMAADYYVASAGETETQQLAVGIGFTDSSYRNVTFLNPGNHETASTLQLASYEPDEIYDGRVGFKIRTMGCGERVKYAASSGTWPADVTFDMCEDAGGAALTAVSDDGTSSAAYSEGDIDYASIYFLNSWFGVSGDPADDSGYYALIDNATLYRDKEIEIQILDAGGNVLQSSTVEDGFYVDPNEDIATLRIYLRSSKPDAAPVINSVAVKDGWDVEVTAGAVAAEFAESRLGTLFVVGPKSDMLNEDLPIRSLCTDPLEGDEIACLSSLNSRYGTNGYRWGLSPGHLQATLNADGTDYDFALTESGEIYLNRVVEFSGYGMDMLAILQKDGTVYYDDPDDGRSWAVGTSVNELPDPAGVRSETEQAYYLMEKYAHFWTGLFNGTTTYTYAHIKSGASAVLPKVTRWEIFNEDNINETTWLDLPAWGHEEDAAARAAIAEEMADLAEDMARIVKADIPDAEVSFTGMAAHYGPVFNTDDLSDYLVHLDSSLFDVANFHPYADMVRAENREDVVRSRWDETVSVLSAHGFSGKDVIFTEYGNTREIYDPGCAYDADLGRYATQSSANLDWERGYGEEEFGKLIARETLTLLGLPVAMVKPYGAHNYANESHGFSAEADGSGGYECWRSHSLYNFHFFERVGGTGILSGVDEPTKYEANDAGTAYLTIAKHLAVSNPVETSISSTDAFTATSGDYYRAQAFDLADGSHAVALWWCRDYNYGVNVPWMGYMGADAGFEEKRVFNVALTGMTDVNSAKLVRLDGTPEESIPVSVSGAITTLQNVVVGEMPVLVKLEYDASIVDTDSDGLADSIDPNVSLANSWWWVNKDKARVSLAASGNYTFVAGKKIALPALYAASKGGVTVKGVLDASKAQSTVIYPCPERPASAGLTKEELLSSSPGTGVVVTRGTGLLSGGVVKITESTLASRVKNYGICVKDATLSLPVKNLRPTL